MEQKIAIANIGSDPPQTAISIQMIGGGGGRSSQSLFQIPGSAKPRSTQWCSNNLDNWCSQLRTGGSLVGRGRPAGWPACMPNWLFAGSEWLQMAGRAGRAELGTWGAASSKFARPLRGLFGHNFGSHLHGFGRLGLHF